MRILSLLIGSLPLSLGTDTRRLIIDGSEADIATYPYVVSLMYCKYALQGLSCASFCSGSLVAPDVVLTAGHCVFNSDDSAFNHSVPAVPVNNMYALIGSGNWKTLSSGSRLVKVTSVSNAGYGTNKRFPMDDDVGLVFLAECVPSPTAVIATRATEQLNQRCAFVTSLGFGTHSNVPREIFSHDGKLRVLRGDSLHSHSACVASYMDALRRSDASSTELTIGELEIDESKHLCAGGDSVASTCFGDSGGPVMLNDVVVGTTSFGAFGVCMASPDFMARVSTYAEWIRDQMFLNSKKCRPVSESFASWPLPVVNMTSAGRCNDASKWQCASSGECVDIGSVCDRTTDCTDGSDEDPYFCRVEFIKFPFGNRQDNKKEALVDTEQAGSQVEAEFNQLLFGSSESVKFFGSGITSQNAEMESKDITVNVVGMLFSVTAKTRRLFPSGRRSSSPAAPPTTSCSARLQSLETSLIACIEPLRAFATQVEFELKYGNNRFELDPEPVTSSCAVYKRCIQDTSGEDFYDYLSASEQCVRAADPRALSPVIAGQWSLVQFCGETLDAFIAMNATKSEYAKTFSEKFQQPVCQFSLPVGKSEGTTTPSATLGISTLTAVACIIVQRVFS